MYNLIERTKFIHSPEGNGEMLYLLNQKDRAVFLEYIYGLASDGMQHQRHSGKLQIRKRSAGGIYFVFQKPNEEKEIHDYHGIETIYNSNASYLYNTFRDALKEGVIKYSNLLTNDARHEMLKSINKWAGADENRKTLDKGILAILRYAETPSLAKDYNLSFDDVENDLMVAGRRLPTNTTFPNKHDERREKIKVVVSAGHTKLYKIYEEGELKIIDWKWIAGMEKHDPHYPTQSRHVIEQITFNVLEGENKNVAERFVTIASQETYKFLDAMASVMTMVGNSEGMEFAILEDVKSSTALMQLTSAMDTYEKSYNVNLGDGWITPSYPGETEIYPLRTVSPHCFKFYYKVKKAIKWGLSFRILTSPLGNVCAPPVLAYKKEGDINEREMAIFINHTSILINAISKMEYYRDEEGKHNTKKEWFIESLFDSVGVVVD